MHCNRVSILEFLVQTFHFDNNKLLHKRMCCLGSVAGPVMQTTGRTDFEVGLRTATTVEVRNDLHSVCTNPEVNMAGPLGPTMTLGSV